MDFSNNQTTKDKILKVFGFCLKQIRKNGENRPIVTNQGEGLFQVTYALMFKTEWWC